MLGQQKNLFAETGNLISQGNTYTQALALMDLAGVKAGDSLAVMGQKVTNLITGYHDMSVQGGILSNTVNAVTFASLQQQSDITTLTGDWTTFFTMVTSGLTGLYAFGAAINTLTGHYLPGLGAAVVTGGQNFIAAAAAAQTEAGSLMTLASAAGLGSKGTDLVTSSVKDMIAPLLSSAKNSQDLTTVLYALAQQGGYQGADSFKALSQWVTTASGSISAAKNPARQLQDNVQTLTVAAGNLTTDVKNLSIALGTTLTAAEATAIAAAAGGQKIFTSFASAVLNTGVSSTATRNAAASLAEELLTVSGNSADAKTSFIAFAVGGLKLTQAQADALWNDVTKTGVPALTQAGLSATTAKTKFIDWAENGLSFTKDQASSLYKFVSGSLIPDLNNLGSGSVVPVMNKFIAFARNGLNLSQSAATALWNTLRNQYLDTVGLKAGESRNQFVTLARQLGLTMTAADNLWASLHKVAAGSPYTAHINAVVSGSGSLTYTEKVAASISSGGFSLLAAGGLIDRGTGPTADDVLARVSKGETVVSAADSRKLAPAFRALGIPGYASGGVPQVVPWVQGAEVSFAKAVETSLITAEYAQLKADLLKAAQAAAAKAAAAGAAGTAAPGVQTVARYVMSHGGTRASGAGVGGTVAGESNGDPEVLEAGGGGGAGILQWTPASSAFPIQPIITGNPGRDMGVQLVDMMAYIASRGGIGDLNAAGAAGGPMAAAELFSAYEAPAVPGSDIRPSVVAALYAQGLAAGGKIMSYDKGGALPPGMSLAYNGTGRPEPVGAAGTPVQVNLEFTGTGNAEFDSFMLKWMRQTVRVKGGGDVQQALGRPISGRG